jgi:hypothetical protein
MQLRKIQEQDQENLLALASQKHIKLPLGHEPETRIVRYNALLAYNRLADVITKHASYIGRDNKSSSSKKGFMVTINKKIAEAFGKPVNELNLPNEMEALAIVRNMISRIIKDGERKNQPRKEIKARVYAAIELIVNDYYEKEKLLEQ